jgi:hypothetical protein
LEIEEIMCILEVDVNPESGILSSRKINSKVNDLQQVGEKR